MGVVRESLEFDTSSATRSLGDVRISLTGVAEGADVFSSRASKAAQALGVISPEAQMAAQAIADLSDGLSLIGTSSGAAIIGVAGIGAASIGTVALVAGLTMGILQLAEASAEAIPDLLELQAAAGVELVSGDTRERIERTAGAMDALRTSSSAAGAALADAFSPAITEAATLGIQLALAVRDITIRSADMGMALVDVGVALLDGFAMPMQGAVASVGALLLVASKAADVLGRDGLASELREAGEAAMAFAGDGAISGGIEALKESLAGYRGEALALVGAQTALNKAGQETTRTTTEAAAATDDLAAGVDAAIGRLGGLFDTTGNAIDEANAAVDDIIAAINAVPDSVEAAQQRIAALKAGATQGLGIAGDIAGGGFSGAMGALSQAGPVGAIVAQVIQIVKGIEEGVIGDIHGQMMALFEGLPDLPDQLAQGVEQSISEGIPALAEGIAGLIANMPDMVWRILEASTVGLAQALADAFRGFFEELLPGTREERQATREARREERQAERTAGGGSTERMSASSQTRAAVRGVGPSIGQQVNASLWREMNAADRRNNLNSSSGAFYGPFGPPRVVVGG